MNYLPEGYLIENEEVLADDILIIDLDDKNIQINKQPCVFAHGCCF